MVAPVIEWLTEEAGLEGRAGLSVEMRVISICEFRGLATPRGELQRLGVDVVQANQRRWRPTPAAGGMVAGRLSERQRDLARAAAWWLLLRRGLRRCWLESPELVVLPNDAAFPFDGMVRMLKSKGVPFLLLQEGIRYPLPESAEVGSRNQGQGGASAIAAWGESSAVYFRAKGNPEERIFLTGNPRFDTIARSEWSRPARDLAARLGLAGETLVFLSNPIEDHGVCTEGEKLALVGRFLEGLAPLFESPSFRLVIKLHSSETVRDFDALCAKLPYRERVVLASDVPLYPLLAAVDGAVILSSTAGLEALLFGLPLAVLEVPGAGFLGDFVSGGGAVGLSHGGEEIAEQVRRFLAGGLADRAAVAGYLESTLATRDEAAARIGGLILDLLGGEALASR